MAGAKPGHAYPGLYVLVNNKLENYKHMKHNKPLYITLLIICSFSNGQIHAQSSLRLWYRQPAQIWEATLPLGNGRLGAMPDGGVDEEYVILNEITLWSGQPQDADNPEAIEYLPEIRRLLFEGHNDEAEKLMYKTFVCKGKGSGHGRGANDPYGSYQILGNLLLKYEYPGKGKPGNYLRELLLDSALAKCRFDKGGIRYTREYFTDFANDVVVIRLAASAQGMLNFSVGLGRRERFAVTTAGEELRMQGRLNNGTDGRGMRYIARVRVTQEGGKLTAHKKTLQVEKAREAVIYISMATDFRNNPYERQSADLLKSAMNQTGEKQLSAHIKAYQKLFHRAHINLGNKNPNADLPTDERLHAFIDQPDDNGLSELYFNFGRYLLISSTRPGILPPNLQGLWAKTIQTPWNGDYHLDINIQMNHWPLDVTNLPMLNQPFEALVADLVQPGSKTAKVYYDGDGWVAHVITNVWGYTSPGEHPSWGATNSGSGWLCQMLWRHYAFTRDPAYLEKIYPILKGSAQFYLSSLVKDPGTGWLATAPSNSPENSFYLPNGSEVHVCMGPTVDNQIIRELFTHVIKADNLLNRDRDFSQKLEAARAALPPNRIGKDGRLMEWLREYREAQPRHRHVSHLWGMYPGTEITVSGTPKLAEAVKASLEGRGDEGTGWSLAWKVNLWARLGDGDRAFKLLRTLLRPATGENINMVDGGGTYPNLFCAHPPYQIDGNFGGTAGIAEMLIQSQQGFVEFLPALPSQWKTGNFDGLRVRGGAETGATWVEGKLKKAQLRAARDHTFKIKIPEYAKNINVKIDGQPIAVSASGGMLEMPLKAGAKMDLIVNDP